VVVEYNTAYSASALGVDLRGDIAVVTGAAGGLGRRFARVLASAGAKVAVIDRRLNPLQGLADEIAAAGGESVAIEMDLRDVSAVRPAFDRIERAFGLANILINNAGIIDAMPTTESSLELIDDVINTNFRAPLLMSSELARRLIKAGKPGRIVNLSSAAAYHYTPHTNLPIYSATKAAVSRLTEVLAMDWARYHINVNAMAPGLFHSEMVDSYLQVVGDSLVQSFERKRVGQAADLDSTLLYLVSPSSGFVTGTIVRVDDGQLPR
jgi:NAD(P)-dependent dehydrogenase (short-subunit alcohol dehydrogenase family)